MDAKDIKFTDDGKAIWASMGDYNLISPNHAHRIELQYMGEPPHGDSYHHGIIDGQPFPGYLWGCNFAFSSCSRYFVSSWMTKFFERFTVVVDLHAKSYFVLPEYLYDFKVCWPLIVGVGKLSDGKQYSFNGNEQWLQY